MNRPDGPAAGPTAPADHPALTGDPVALAAVFNRTSPGTLAERMGITLVSVTAGEVVATMPVAGNTQPYGLLHGGASCVLAETLGSVGAAVHAAGLGRVAVGIDLNATHHRAARDGVVTGTARALSLGTTLASYEIVVDDAAGRRICTARLSCVLRPPAGGAAGPG